MKIVLNERNLEIRLSKAAQRALAARETPLLAEMELLFSCLIRKRVRFSEQVTQDAMPAVDRLAVRFRPVMTRVCKLSETEGHPPMDDFPIADPRPYMPRWLAIDYRRGQWLGEFGY